MGIGITFSGQTGPLGRTETRAICRSGLARSVRSGPVGRPKRRDER
jgi:hypothetical protein